MKRIILFFLLLPLLAKAQTGTITTVAGTVSNGFTGDGGPASTAQLSYPGGIAVDANGAVYICDYGNSRIRSFYRGGNIHTYAGNSSTSCASSGVPATTSAIGKPSGVTVDRWGTLFFTDDYGSQLNMVTYAGLIFPLAGHCGTASFGGDGGPASVALLKSPSDVAVDKNYNIYIADAINYRIRKIDINGVISTYAGNGAFGYSGDGGSARSAAINEPVRLAVDGSGNLFFTDGQSHVRRIDAATGIITTIAGTSTSGYSGDGAPASFAKLNWPNGLAVDGAGNVFIADRFNNRIRMVSPAGIITTVAGTGSVGYTGDGGPAIGADLSYPSGLCTDADGNVYFIDYPSKVRFIYLNEGPTAFVNGHTQSAFACDTLPMQLDTLLAIYDFDTLQTETWEVATSPGHGTLSASYFGHSNRGIAIPASMSYIAEHGYTGIDSFSVRVNDGHTCDTTKIYITVRPLPHAGPITGDTAVCTGSMVTLTGVDTGGTWTATNANATLAGNVVTGISIGLDTIAYTVANSCGIDTAYHAMIVSLAPYAAPITGPAAVCVGATITLSDTSAGGSWSSTTGHASVTGSGIVTGVTAGDDTIKYSVTTPCGTAVSVMAVTVIPLPNAGAITGHTTICEASTDTLRSTASGGTWSVTNANATISATGLITGASAGLDTAIYSFTNSCGTDAASVVVTTNPLPNVGTISGTPFVCAGNSISLTRTGTNGGTWSRSNSNASMLISATGIVVNGVTPGLDTISYALTNSCGTLVTSQVVTIGQVPHAGAITGTTVVCEAAADTLIDTASGGTWTATNSHATVTGITGGGVVMGVSAGIDTIVYTITNACGTDRVRKAITINPLPHAGAITGAAVVCEGSSDTLTASVSGGTWAMSNANALMAPATTQNVITGINTGIDTVMYSVTNSCGTDIAMLPVTINPLPHAGLILGSAIVCEAATTTLNATVTGGTWVLSNGRASVLPVALGAVITGISAGADTLIYSVTNSCGTDVATQVITINPLPHAGAITGSGTVCEGSIDTLNNLTTGGLWTLSNGNATILPLLSGSIVTGVSAGMDTVMYAVTNSCGMATATMIVAINPLPHAGVITGSPSVCEASSDTLTDTVSGGTWAISNGNATLAPMATMSAIAGVAAGLDTVFYSVTNSCGTDIASQVISINPLPHAGTITGSTIVCEGSTDTLNNTAATGTWAVANSHATIAAFLTGGVLTGVSEGTDTVIYTVSNSCGTDITTQEITINPLPHAGVITGAAIVCEAGLISLSDTVIGGTWSVSNTTASIVPIGASSSITGMVAGMDTVMYAVTNSCGTDIASHIVTINPLPHAGIITGTPVVCEAATIALYDTVAGGTWALSNTSATQYPIAGGVTLAGNTAGLDTLTYSVTNSCGTDITTQVVTVSPLPHAGLIGGPAAICEGSASTLTSTVSGGIWASSGSHSSIYPVSAGAMVSGITPGADTITYLFINSCGFDTAVRIVAISPLPHAGSITGAMPICPGYTDTLTDTASGGTWSVSNTNATVLAIAGGSIVTGVTSGLDTVAYSVTNSCGTDIAKQVITVSPLPNAGLIVGAAAICPGTTDTLTSTMGGGIWTARTGNVSIVPAAAGVVATGITPGMDTITYLVINSCGFDTSMHIVTINPLPHAGAITGIATLCEGSSDTLTNTATGGTWLLSNANATLLPLTGGSVITALAAGIDTITYAVTNFCGTDIATHILAINPLPHAGNIAGPAVVCEGSSINLINPASGGTWAITNGKATLAPVTYGRSVTGVSPGLDTVIFTVTNSCGTEADTAFITINALPNAGVVTGFDSICIASNNTLSGSVAGGTWAISNANATFNSSATICTVYGVKAGGDTLMYIVVNTCGADTAKHSIVVSPLPEAGTINGPATLCIGKPVKLTGTIAGGIWGTIHNHVSFKGDTISGVTPGKDTIIYTVNSSCGTAFATYFVAVSPMPFAGSITGPATICIDSVATLYTTGTGGAWGAQNGNATVDAGIITGKFKGLDTISYSVTNSCGLSKAIKFLSVDSCAEPLPVIKEGIADFYPNPTSESVTISQPHPGDFDQFAITTASGALVISGSLQPQKTEVSLRALPEGIYFIRVTGQHHAWAERIVKY